MYFLPYRTVELVEDICNICITCNRDFTMFQSDAETAALFAIAVAAVVLHMNDHIKWKEDKKNGHPTGCPYS